MIKQGIDDMIVMYGTEILRRPDGQLMVGNEYIMSEQTWGELTSGYRCAWCMHAQSVAWPEVCEFGGTYEGKTWSCRSEANERDPHRGLIRDHQMEFLAQELRARADFNPPDPYDVLDIEQEDWKPGKTGLLVPRDLDA